MFLSMSCFPRFSSFLSSPKHMLVGGLAKINCPELWNCVCVCVCVGGILNYCNPDQDKVITEDECLNNDTYRTSMATLLAAVFETSSYCTFPGGTGFYLICSTSISVQVGLFLTSVIITSLSPFSKFSLSLCYMFSHAKGFDRSLVTLALSSKTVLKEIGCVSLHSEMWVWRLWDSVEVWLFS